MALYFFIIDHANHLGWPLRFGIPLDFASAAIGIKKMQTVSEYLKDLEKYGFIKIVTKSLNQHTANIIEIVATPKNGKALGKARGKADGEPQGKATVRHRAYNKTDETDELENTVTGIWEGVFSNAFASEWNSWLKYRKSQKKELKGESIQRNFNSLVKLSGRNEETAIAIIDQSISQGWTGLFELKNVTARPTQPTFNVFDKSATPPDPSWKWHYSPLPEQWKQVNNKLPGAL